MRPIKRRPCDTPTVQAVVAMAQAVHSARFGNFSHTFWQAMQMVPTTLAKAGPN